jgi:hypothetical protein
VRSNSTVSSLELRIATTGGADVLMPSVLQICAHVG